MLRVEVNRAVEHWPDIFDQLQYDGVGNTTLSYIRPQLLPSEMLLERSGQISSDVGAGPTHLTDMIPRQVIRAVTGEQPPCC